MKWFISVIFVVVVCNLDATRTEDAGENKNDSKRRIRVAVIGGGIGGTTAALFLREEFGDEVDIDVYENDRIGGRLATIEMGGRYYESGGSVIHPRNKYMANLTRFLGLNVRKDFPEPITFGLYNGNEIVFQTHRYPFFSSFVNGLRLLWRYGFDLLNLDPWINGVLSWYAKIYPAQQTDKLAFSSVYQLFHGLSSLFDDLVSSSIGDYLTKLGFGRLFQNELARIAMRTNYGQDLDIQGFVGAVSLAGAQGGLWSVEGGNYRVAEEALAKSKARLVKYRVTKVTEMKREGESTSYRLTAVDEASAGLLSSASEESHDYDAVVLAVPCTVRGCGDIAFEVEGIEAKLTKFPSSYHRTVANFVKGKLDTKRFFGVAADHFPDCLYSIAGDALLFMSLCRNVPVDYGNRPDDPKKVSDLDVYKIFTRTPLTELHVDRLFKSHSDFAVVDWLAYPEYDRIPDDVEAALPSFVLDTSGGLVSVNAIEASASAMEQSVIGAKNAALLIAKHLKGQ